MVNLAQGQETSFPRVPCKLSKTRVLNKDSAGQGPAGPESERLGEFLSKYLVRSFVDLYVPIWGTKAGGAAL